VLKAISRYNMIPSRGDRPARVIAAVSGGADSVCLLHVLREIGADLAGVAHFNHKLRAEASDEDERFVAALAARFEIPFYQAESGAGVLEGNLEQAARRARRGFFAQLIRDGAADCVALGHTRDDQAETVLFRVLRGSGLAGLAGIHPVTADGLIRPLIETTRAEVEDYLRSRGVVWREDSSNRDLRFARNRIRHELLPQLAREWNPRIAEALANLADLAFEEERLLRSQEPGVRSQNKTAVELSVEEMMAAPRAVARRVVRQAIAEAKGDLRGIEFQHIERVIEMRAGRIRLPGIEVTRSFDWIRIAPAGGAIAGAAPFEAVSVTVPGTYAGGGSAVEIRLEIDETPAAACANLKTELAAPIILRGWKPGDHYRPVGKSRDQKLKEMFQNARIPSWRRRAWPILESGGKILWAREFGAAQEFDATGHPGPVLRVWDLAKSGPAQDTGVPFELSGV
jgi:tRNA(Ile)-lysidine synthase